MTPGPVALVGSGEYLPAMEDVDRGLLTGRPARAICLPTAAGEEGLEAVRYWTELAQVHYRKLGVEPIALPVLDRHDADNPEWAAAIEGAGLIYLSGGNPGYLAETLRDTLVWRAIVAAWQAGAAVAGCSAGAGALTTVVHDVRRRDRGPLAGLGLVGQMAVIPHFDRIEQWAPGIVERFVADAPAGAVVVGVDEETALVGPGDRWTVQGHRRVWRIERDGTRRPYEPGQDVELPTG